MDALRRLFLEKIKCGLSESVYGMVFEVDGPARKSFMGYSCECSPFSCLLSSRRKEELEELEEDLERDLDDMARAWQGSRGRERGNQPGEYGLLSHVTIFVRSQVITTVDNATAAPAETKMAGWKNRRVEWNLLLS